jgi:cytochrome b561
MSGTERAASPGAALVTAERVLSVLIFLGVIWQLYQSTKVGVTPRGTPAREALQHNHISLGLTLLVFVIARLRVWARMPRPPRPARVPAPADALARHCNFAFYLTVLSLCVTGPFFAWSDGHAVSWYGVFDVPALIEQSYRVSVTLGYVHSVIGFWILYLSGFSVCVALWQLLRYRTSPLRMLPGFGWGR